MVAVLILIFILLLVLSEINDTISPTYLEPLLCYLGGLVAGILTAAMTVTLFIRWKQSSKKCDFLQFFQNLAPKANDKLSVVPCSTKFVEPHAYQQPHVIQQPHVTQQPYMIQQLHMIQQPQAGQQPHVIQQPHVTQKPHMAQQPCVIQQPYTAQQQHFTVEGVQSTSEPKKKIGTQHKKVSGDHAQLKFICGNTLHNTQRNPAAAAVANQNSYEIMAPNQDNVTRKNSTQLESSC